MKHVCANLACKSENTEIVAKSTRSIYTILRWECPHGHQTRAMFESGRLQWAEDSTEFRTVPLADVVPIRPPSS